MAIRRMNKTRKIGLDMVFSDVRQDNKISRNTLRYCIDHNIDVYAADVKEMIHKARA